jgi:hypothetical protein
VLEKQLELSILLTIISTIHPAVSLTNGDCTSGIFNVKLIIVRVQPIVLNVKQRELLSRYDIMMIYMYLFLLLFYIFAFNNFFFLSDIRTLKTEFESGYPMDLVD